MPAPFTVASLLGAFPHEDACVDEIWRLRFAGPDGKAWCGVCGKARRFYRVRGRRSYSCERCRAQRFATAGTVLERARIPMRAWFEALVVYRTRRRPPTAIELQEHLSERLSYKAVRRLTRTLDGVFTEGAAPRGVDAADFMPARPAAGPEHYLREHFERDLRRLLRPPARQSTGK